MKFSLFVFLTLMLFPYSIWGQYKNLDSLFLQYPSSDVQEKIESVLVSTASGRDLHFEGKNEIYSEVLALSNEIKYAKGIAGAHYCVGLVEFNRGSYSESLIHFEKANTQYKKLGIEEKVAKTNFMIGNCYSMMDKGAMATRYLTEAGSFFYKTGNNTHLAAVLLGLGNVEISLSNLKESSRYYQLAFEQFLTLKDTFGMGLAKMNLGIVHKEKQEYETSLSLRKEALNYFQIIGDSVNILKVNSNILNTLFKLGRYREVDSSLKVLIPQFKKKNLSYLLTQAYILKTGVHFNTQDFGQAETYAIDAIQIAKENGIRDLKLDAYDWLSSIYEKKENPTQALDYLRKYIALKDSIRDSEVQSILSNWEDRLKDQKNLDELEKRELIINQQNFRNRALYFGIVLIILASILIIFLLNHKKRIIKLEKDNLDLSLRELKESFLSLEDYKEMLRGQLDNAKSKINSLENQENDEEVENLTRVIKELKSEFDQVSTKGFQNNVRVSSGDVLADSGVVMWKRFSYFILESIIMIKTSENKRGYITFVLEGDEKLLHLERRGSIKLAWKWIEETEATDKFIQPTQSFIVNKTKVFATRHTTIFVHLGNEEIEIKVTDNFIDSVFPKIPNRPIRKKL